MTLLSTSSAMFAKGIILLYGMTEISMARLNE